MRLNAEKLKKICKNNGLSLALLLRHAGVSKTAYYHLVAKENLLPKSLGQMARALGVTEAALLLNTDPILAKVKQRRKRMTQVLSQYPTVDPENVWHTLILLEQPPWDRLNQGLLRAQNFQK